MLSGIHFLLTYTCNFECDHCFLCCSPRVSGTFTISQIREILDEATKIDTMESIFYEGGEPFLYYPILVEAVKLARNKKLRTGLVSNCYWSTALEDAGMWLGPLKEAGIDDLHLSDDTFHADQETESPGRRAVNAAKKLGMSPLSICIDPPVVEVDTKSEKGDPVIGGGARFRGRAADKLTEGLPRRPCEEFTSCPYEELVKPKRVHVDSFGNAQVCQGLSMGNLWETPLSELDRTYDHRSHPIIGPLVAGGPAQLAKEYHVELEDAYVDECHMCYEVRKALIDRFPQYLGPRQVYGLDQE
jgi:hypothetical protein